MGKEWDIVEVLRHSRHDWLNKLQVIKGNLDLNRIDRAKQVIDEIVIEAQHETKLSNLHMPLFASLLLKSNWENPFFKLEYEVMFDPDASKINDLAVTNWTLTFFGSLNQAIEPFQENNLSITIEPQADGIRFFFDFSGIIRNRELMELFLSNKTVDVSVKELTETELSLELFMPTMENNSL
jgi:stage 0 sporulation protein B (sporulation initiation phosphotransferase)